MLHRFHLSHRLNDNAVIFSNHAARRSLLQSFPKAGFARRNHPWDKWAYEHGVELDFSRPGKPTDNAKVESFNGRFREECLNAHWFLSLEDAKGKIEAWRRYYNEDRPHSAHGWMTPAEFAEQCRNEASKEVLSEPEISS